MNAQAPRRRGYSEQREGQKQNEDMTLKEIKSENHVVLLAYQVRLAADQSVLFLQVTLRMKMEMCILGNA